MAAPSLRRPQPRGGCPGSVGYEPVVRSSRPRSRARRSLDRKIAVVASVTSAPVTNKATTTVAASGAAEPVTAVHGESRPTGLAIRPRHQHGERRRQLAGDPRVVRDQRDVRRHGRTAGDRGDAGEQPGRDGGAGDPGLVGLADRLLDRRARDFERQGVRLRDRVADHEPGPQAHRFVGADDGGRGRDVRHVAGRRDPASAASRTRAPRRSRRRRPARPASRGTRGSAARRGSPWARRTRRRPASGPARRGRPRCRTWRGSAPPDPARRGGRRRCRRSRRRRIPAASAAIIVAATVVAPHSPDAIASPRLGRETLRTVPRGAVASASSSSAESPTSSRPAVERHGRGHGAGRPDRGLGRGRDLDVLRVGQPVADERGLERDDGRAVAQRVGDLGGDGEAVGGDHDRQGTSGDTARAGAGRCGRRLSAMPTPRRRAPGSPPPRPSATRSSSRSTTSPRTARSPSSRAGSWRARRYVSHLWLVPLDGGEPRA